MLKRDRETEPVCHRCSQSPVAQSEIRGVPDDAGGVVDQPRGAQADGSATGTDESSGGPHDGGDNGFRPLGAWSGRPQRLPAHPLHIEPRGLDGGPAEIDGDNIGGAAHQYP
jgi:hypothetical protein